MMSVAGAHGGAPTGEASSMLAVYLVQILLAVALLGWGWLCGAAARRPDPGRTRGRSGQCFEPSRLKAMSSGYSSRSQNFTMRVAPWIVGDRLAFLSAGLASAERSMTLG